MKLKMHFVALLLFGIGNPAPPDLHAQDAKAYKSEIVITPLLKTQKDGAGNKLVYPTNGNAEATAVLVEIPPGAQTGWHKHPVPCFAYILEGELQVELETGKVETLKAGHAFAEVVNVLHNGINRGSAPVKLVMLVVGVEAQPFAVRPPEAEKPAAAEKK